MKRTVHRWMLVGIVVLVVAGLALIVRGVLHRSDSTPPADGPAKAQVLPVPPPPARPAPASRPASRSASLPATGALPTPASGPAMTVDPAKGGELLDTGLQLLAGGQLIAARAALADALNSGGLNAQQADQVREKLTELADKTLFNRQVVEGDPCTAMYTMKSGDLLVKVERALSLRVPTQLVCLINGIGDSATIQSGQKLKIIRGPFHAVVSKKNFTMDVYLEEYGTGRMIFCRRYGVGLGKEGSTPTGQWRLALGGKIGPNAPWSPPPSSNLPRKKYMPGESGYALGKRGMWISLEGINGNPWKIYDGYGIHDTPDQNSIGTNASMGCVRMRDSDIDQVFALLYEFWSKVHIID